MVDLEFRGVGELRDLIATGEVTAREVVQHSLERIGRLDPVLNAFAWVRGAEALAEADELDREQAEGRLRGPLHGVPIAIKDENDVAGLPTAYGGASVTSSAAADSELVRRLRAAGAVIVGKTRMPEFGIWPWTETSANGYTRNPWNPLRSPAGSSGGTAAAVASGMVPAGIGGDGGGSIRLPSSYCGLFGLKPQRGRISAAPNADLWRSLGVLGPLTRSVADSALIYDAVAGSTAADRFSAQPWTGSLAAAATTAPARLRIGLAVKNPGGGPAADAETTEALHRTARALRDLGHEVVEVTPAYPKLALPFMLQVLGGVSDEAARVEHPRLLEKRTRTMVRIARPLLAFSAAAERRGIADGERFLASLFDGIDLLLMPTTPTPAVPVGQLDGRGFWAAMAAATPTASFTSIWNVLGNPAAAIPTGFSVDGLPLSGQVVGPANSEELVIAVCAQLERVQPWADRRPPVGGRG
ncbi:amidase [Cryobacterium sp. SO2]|uniref:amidase n=1 Tax=Cryobacterium sp. SO2 TaxID=1897060 RepID=UPI00223D9EE7|nr:amidase [Cryobacterium sp. SO2]WEO77949.1 amidase [Cryobacterium sp. SO2]